MVGRAFRAARSRLLGQQGLSGRLRLVLSFLLTLLLAHVPCSPSDGTAVCGCKQGSPTACEALRVTDPKKAAEIEQAVANAKPSPTQPQAQQGQVTQTAAPPASKGIEDLLRPGGRLIGSQGSSPKIRIIKGGLRDAEKLFEQLSGGGTRVNGTSYPGPLVRLPNGGTVGLRPSSTSGPPTIDVTVQGIGIREIKFLP